MRYLNRCKRGDTIVEVFLALAVIGTVLAGAYASTTRSLRAGRDAQERSEALELAKGQLEGIKKLSAETTSAGGIFAETEPFCLTLDLQVVKINATDPTATISTPDLYDAACKQVPLYAYSIVRAGDVFTVRVLWPSLINASADINGTILNGFGEVKMIYRAHQL